MSSKFFLKFKHHLYPTAQNQEFNINQIFKPFYIILTLFGLFPYSVSYNNSRERFVIIRKSIFINTFCAGTYAVVMSVFCILHIKYILNSEGNDNSLTDVLLTQLNYLLEIGALVVYCIVTYISTFLNRFKYASILNSVCAMWTEPRNKSQNEIMGRLRFQVNILAIGAIIAVTILHMCMIFTRDGGFWKKMLVICTGVLPSVIQTIVLAFHYILVMMVVAVLADINRQLLKLSKRRKTSEVLYVEVESSRMKYSLKRLEQSYTKVFEIKCEINEAFQATLLVSTIQCFHCIISEAYTIYHGLMEHLLTLHNTINCLFWIMLQLLKVYSLSYSGNLLKNEATKIGQALHAIPTEKQDIKLLMEIQHFATMMNYEKFVLTCYGYFPLNATLMSGMIANVTMYLIILIQFDKSNDSTAGHPAAI